MQEVKEVMGITTMRINEGEEWECNGQPALWRSTLWMFCFVHRARLSQRFAFAGLYERDEEYAFVLCLQPALGS